MYNHVYCTYIKLNHLDKNIYEISLVLSMLVKHLLAYKKYETVDQLFTMIKQQVLLDHFDTSTIFSHVCYQF